MKSAVSIKADSSKIDALSFHSQSCSVPEAFSELQMEEELT